mmetsp:Transcript_11569/g.13115  ORF Transcript_11569/g.13115 Transcript_11569/m.13115 type:complete len:114 (+) Transcript_11569:450-791(+)
MCPLCGTSLCHDGKFATGTAPECVVNEKNEKVSLYSQRACPTQSSRTDATPDDAATEEEEEQLSDGSSPSEVDNDDNDRVVAKEEEARPPIFFHTIIRHAHHRTQPQERGAGV